MDNLTFIVEIVKAIAWPLGATVIALSFKSEIAKLIPRLRKLKHKETELEFSETVEQLVKDTKEKGLLISPPAKDSSLQKDYEFLSNLLIGVNHVSGTFCQLSVRPLIMIH